MSRRRGLWISGGIALVLFVVLLALDLRMRDAGGPGIISFELAGSEERAAEIVADWGEEGRDAARASLWLDFPYLIAYAVFLTLAVSAVRDLARRRGLRRLTAAGVGVVALPSSAAAFDAIEDVALLVALDGRGGEAAPLLAAICASIKFALLLFIVLYLATGLVAARRAAPAAS